jgi:hypothetical protein
VQHLRREPAQQDAFGEAQAVGVAVPAAGEDLDQYAQPIGAGGLLHSEGLENRDDKIRDFLAEFAPDRILERLVLRLAAAAGQGE